MNIALSFSGGKDSCFALYRLHQQGYQVVCLLTIVDLAGEETVAHEEELGRIEQQARRIGIPVQFIKTDFKHYKDNFILHLNKMKEKYEIKGIAFGDIYLESHRQWGEQMSKQAGIEAIYPLWTCSSNVVNLLSEFVSLPFQASVVKVDNTKLPESWVGRLLDDTFVADIQGRNVCPMGESGEYHTTVIKGPIFKNR